VSLDRRNFLQLLTTGALAGAFPDSIARALAIPANTATGTIMDVQHVVIMMQENRSFDHYFGTLQGVRGFSDPRAMKLANGNSVFYQPAATNVSGNAAYVLPFHPGAANLGLQFIQDLPHDWTTTHEAWNQGKFDQWIPMKTTTSMAHLQRADIPYHYALADAFTICDAYHCGLLGPTDPNRYYMWSGWVGNDGNGGGPVVDNAEAGYGWTTFPERLQKAGVSWKIYQDIGTGLNAAGTWGDTSDAYIGNYGDNALLYFNNYRNATSGNPLYEKARTGTNLAASGDLPGNGLFAQFKADVLNNTLPSVSWLVAPEAYTEHPNWPANYGAWYVSQVLDALTANPAVWSKTVFLLTYDENDGFFDHMVPPTVPETRAQGLSQVATTNEIFPGTAEYPAGPYGMGIRVPMVVISPWSKGGYVNSQLFDHTSMIRFLEARFGGETQTSSPLYETNITPWRRAVGGDLTSCFNFGSPNSTFGKTPSTAAYLPPDNQRHPDYVPVPPAVQTLPVQEPGTRKARALPYEMDVTAAVDLSTSSLLLTFANSGTAAVVFQVRSADPLHGPWTYTVSPGSSLTDTIPFSATSAVSYDVSVFGPNGFFREFSGSTLPAANPDLELSCTYDKPNQAVHVLIANRGNAAVPLQFQNVYSKQNITATVPASGEINETFWMASTTGWYDVVLTSSLAPGFSRRLSGHIENGKEYHTDPAIGTPAT